MTYAELNALLVNRVPASKGTLDELRRLDPDDEPGSYLVYGFFTREVADALRASDHPPWMKAYFDLAEELASSPDVSCHDLAVISMCEHLVCEPALYEAAKRYMGSATLNACEEARTGLGIGPNEQ